MPCLSGRNLSIHAQFWRIISGLAPDKLPQLVRELQTRPGQRRFLFGVAIYGAGIDVDGEFIFNPPFCHKFQDVSVVRTITHSAVGGLISSRDFTDLVINVHEDDAISTNGKIFEVWTLVHGRLSVRNTNIFHHKAFVLKSYFCRHYKVLFILTATAPYTVPDDSIFLVRM